MRDWIRKDEPFDSPCSDGNPPRDWKGPTYLVDAEQLYDADLHLRATIAYPKGC